MQHRSASVFPLGVLLLGCSQAPDQGATSASAAAEQQASEALEGRLRASVKPFDHKEHEQALQLFSRRCEQGEVRACATWGRTLEQSPSSTAADWQRAAPALKVACDGQEWQACTALGTLHAFGRGKPKAYDQALKLFRTACDHDELRGCAQLGVLYDEARGATRDDLKAVELYKRACDGGEPLGCAWLASMYKVGEGVAPDPVRARALAEPACTAGEPVGCLVMGWLFREGATGTERDEPKAVELFQQACSLNQPNACRALGVVTREGSGGLQKDAKRGLALLERGCELGEAHVCFELAATSFDSAGDGLAPGRAFQLFVEACKEGILGACLNEGIARCKGTGTAVDIPGANAVWRKACQDGQFTSCGWLGIGLTGAECSERRDDKQAREYLTQACNANVAVDCDWLGSLLEQGRGGPRDLRRAEAAYKKACEGDVAPACESARRLGKR